MGPNDTGLDGEGKPTASEARQAGAVSCCCFNTGSVVDAWNACTNLHGYREFFGFLPSTEITLIRCMNGIQKRLSLSTVGETPQRVP